MDQKEHYANIFLVLISLRFLTRCINDTISSDRTILRYNDLVYIKFLYTLIASFHVHEYIFTIALELKPLKHEIYQCLLGNSFKFIFDIAVSFFMYIFLPTHIAFECAPVVCQVVQFESIRILCAYSILSKESNSFFSKGCRRNSQNCAWQADYLAFYPIP